MTGQRNAKITNIKITNTEIKNTEIAQTEINNIDIKKHGTPDDTQNHKTLKSKTLN